MRAKVSNVVNGLTLVGLGSVFLVFYVSGRIDRYLNPIFRPLVLIAGMAIVFAGLVYLMTTHSDQCCVDEDCVHGHVNSPRWSLAFFGVICLPVFFGAISSKDAFDRLVVVNRGFAEDASKLTGTRSFHRSVFGNPVSPANVVTIRSERCCSISRAPNSGVYPAQSVEFKQGIGGLDMTGKIRVGLTQFVRAY
jgi:hypothetical protein